MGAATPPAGVSSLLAPGAFAPGVTDRVEFLRRVQQEHPADFWANLTLGNALINHRPAEAIAYYQAALAMRPQAVVAHINLGMAMLKVGRPRQAIDLLRRGLRIAPRDPLLLNNMGLALQEVGRPVEATKHFRQALVEWPKLAVIHSNLANALQATGQIDDAIAHYQEAVRLDPMDSRFHSNLGLAQLSKGRLDEALGHFRQADRLSPTSVKVKVCLGIALQRKGRLEEAIAQYQAALCLDPQDAKAHYNLGDALLGQGHTEEGLACIRRAIPLDPRFAAPHYSLGNVLREQGRLNEAVDAFQQAIGIDPNLASAHYNLGNTLKVLGRLDEAVDHYQQTFRIDPTHAPSLGALGEVLGSLGRFREARAAARRCLELLPRDDPQRPLAQAQLQQHEQLLALEPRLPAILTGEDKPANVVEACQFAEICRIKQKYAAAARLYSDALKAAPALFEDPRTGHRYNAACAAALTGCGDDTNGEKLSEDDRARWRQQARAWLRADLAAWNRKIEGNRGDRHAQVQKTLTLWQADPDLAGLRDPLALFKFPQSEREECRALWQAVDRLRRGAQSAPPK
jgi:tetratricopeptide (TPR) repeat protein